MSATLEKRVEALERQVAQLQKQRAANTSLGGAWIDDIYGSFAGDSVFEQAMKLGREYRKSLRNRSTKSGTRSKR